MNARLAILVASVLALLVHAPAARNGFVWFDDGRFIVRNESIDTLDAPGRFFTDLDTTASADSPTRDIYRPIRSLSFAALASVWGKDPSAFHALSVVLHAGCTALLAALLIAAGFGAWAALLGALLFALHPVTVETTAWACSLGDLWCGLFSLAAILLYARDRLVLALLALVVALFSKEHAVVVPGLWLLWDYSLRPERWRRAILGGAAPGLAVVVAFLWWRAHLGAGMSQIDEPLAGSHANAVLTMLAGFGWYAGTILFPFGPTFQAVVPAQDTMTLRVLLGALVLAGCVWGALRGPVRRRLGFAWFLVALVPASNVFVPLKIPTADRFLYLPLMGLAFVAAWLGARRPREIARAAPVALALLAALTVQRIGDWRNDSTLLSAWSRVNPKSTRVIWAEAALQAKRANDLLDAERFDDAWPRLVRAVELYELYLRNAQPAESVGVYIEMGDLLFNAGVWLERLDDRPRSIESSGGALRAYLHAHRLHQRGFRGRRDGEILHVAQQIVTLCVRLARPDNPRQDETIKVGLDTLQYLAREYGYADDRRFAQLLLLYCIKIRGREPAKAREGLVEVARRLDAVEAAGAPQPFLRAQQLFYRSLLRDREFDRAGLEKARALYLEAAKERGQRLRALFLAARTSCTIGRLMGDEASLADGQRRLAELPGLAAREGLRISAYLQAELEGEEQSCASR